MVTIATLYPGASDTFGVPASPTTTPLSSAGSSTRNHVSHHRDLGDAVTAIQNNVTQLTHTHDGTGLNGGKLLQVNTHQAVDTDSAANSLHHTLGVGATQAAAGNHTHDTRYIRLDGAVDQIVTGKKTFPVGATAIAIPDFRNSNHRHLGADSGGPAMVYGASTSRYLSYLSDNNVPGNVTIDQYLHSNRFTIPANTALIGQVILSYYMDFTGAAGHNTAVHNAFFYLSHNQGESPAWSSAKNLLLNGANFGGQMIQQNHAFTIANTSERRQVIMPIYKPAITTDLANTALVIRIVNTTAMALQELNWGLQLNFQSNILAL